jgi:pimeloyl-ACP methyl ester carboxylesterase
VADTGSVPDQLIDRWLLPLQTRRGVRRDLRRYASSARRRQMLEVCERLRSFDRPALVVWTPEDRVQRPDHGRGLADLLPDAQLVEIPDSYTLIMRDQPAAFARGPRVWRASPAVPR